jgi:hypothetical protein
VRAGVLLAAAALALTGCSAGRAPEAAPPALTSPTAAPGSPTPLPLKTFAGLSHDHVTTHVQYPQTPPVGGPHYPRWLACGVYTSTVPDEAAVHSMEHGGVWITYRPGTPADDVARLAALTRLSPEYVLVSPYEGLPSPVVVSTWGLQLQVDSAADGRVEQFVRTYAGGDQGGEPGAACRTSGLTPDQARALIGS